MDDDIIASDTNKFTLLRPTLCYGFLSGLSGAVPQDGPCSTRVIEGAVTPRACTARPNFYLFHHAYTCVQLIFFRTLRFMQAAGQLLAKRFLDPDQVAPQQGPRKILVNIALNSASPASRRPAAPSKLQQEHLGNRIGNSCRNCQRLELSWSSSSRMRT
jgi:hypothetical protein